MFAHQKINEWPKDGKKQNPEDGEQLHGGAAEICLHNVDCGPQPKGGNENNKYDGQGGTYHNILYM